MRKSIVTSILAVTGLMLLATPALADGPSLTLRVEPGAAFPLSSPQTDRFWPGASLAVKPTLHLLPWFDANITVSGMALASKVDGVAVGTEVGAGVGARVMRPLQAYQAGSFLSTSSPWLDGDFQMVATGPLARPMVSVGAGLALPTSVDWLWAGPFVRYNQLVDSLDQTPVMDNRDSRTLVVGIEFEFGSAAKKPVAAPPPPAPPPPPVVAKKIEAPPPVAPPPPAEVAQITEVVQFNYDSSIPLSAESLLAGVAQKLLAHPGWSVEVDGHASSEGHPASEKHNQQLSERRAQAVRDALVKAGVPADKLTVKGFGSSKPIAPNDTEANRRKNRRVEFTVTVTLRPGASQ